MWTLLLACGMFEALEAPPEPLRGPIPGLHEVDGMLEAAVVERAMAAPTWSELHSPQAYFDFSGPPYVDDLRAAFHADPDSPWLRELLTRPLDPDTRDLIAAVMEDARTCDAALDLGPDVELPVELFDTCPWSLREQVLARFPGAEDRGAWLGTPLPQNLASAFVDGSWLPHVTVRNYPEELPRVRKAAERCVLDHDDVEIGQTCLMAVATVDWDAARAVRHLVGDFGLKTALNDYATGAELEAHLDALGFSPPTGAATVNGTVLDRLERRDALWQPTAIGTIPALWRQVGLDDVTTRFLPGRFTTLHAHHGGVRHRVLLEPLYGADPEQVAGLANVLARKAEAPNRALLVEHPMLGSAVVTGPSAALKALVSEGLVDVPEPLFRDELIRFDLEAEVEVVDTGLLVPAFDF